MDITFEECKSGLSENDPYTFSQKQHEMLSALSHQYPEYTKNMERSKMREELIQQINRAYDYKW